MALAIHLKTLASSVMHDLGELEHTSGRAPQLRDAQRFSAGRAAELGVSSRDADAAARVAISDWRATQRVKTMGDNDAIDRAYLQGRGSIQTIGVRVVLDLKFRGRKPAGAKSKTTILVNVRPGTTVAQAIATACAAWNTHALQVPHGFASGSRCTGTGQIVQVIEGGWAHSQVGV